MPILSLPRHASNNPRQILRARTSVAGRRSQIPDAGMWMCGDRIIWLGFVSWVGIAYVGFLHGDGMGGLGWVGVFGPQISCVHTR